MYLIKFMKNVSLNFNVLKYMFIELECLILFRKLPPLAMRNVAVVRFDNNKEVQVDMELFHYIC